MGKRLILFLALGFCASAAFGETQTSENPRHIRITVDMRQAAFQNQNGTQTASQSTQTQFIVVTEGIEGRIFIGNKVPYATYYQTFLTREGYLRDQIKFQLQDVGTSLVVRARVFGGGQIEVTLTPEISYETQDGRGTIAVQKMSTSVIVPEGQSVEIGGNVATSEFGSHFYRSDSGQSLQIVLTPTILD